MRFLRRRLPLCAATVFLLAFALGDISLPGWLSDVSSVVDAQAPGADALVAAYGFDEAIGSTLIDSSGNGHNGTISGAAWATAGRVGAALSFDGVNDWVTIADAADFDFTTGMSLQAWVRPAALGGWRTALLKERGNGLSYALYAHDNAPRPAAYVNAGGSDLQANGAAQLPLDTWTHLAATYDGAVLRMYVNGALTGSRTVNAAILTSAGPLRIGGNAVWGEYFSGLIDEVRVHSRALSQAEIQTLMTLAVGDAPGFHIIAYNPSVTIGRSDEGTYNLEVSPVGGFTGPVFPSVSGLPPGVTGVFEPPDGPPHPGPMALTVISDATAAPGTYTITISAVEGSLSASTNVSLSVTPDPDIRVTLEPNSLIIAQGQRGEANFQVDSQNGFAQAVSLAATGLPAGATATFTPPSLVPSGAGILEFDVGFLTPPGVYPLVIAATDGTLTRQAAFTLTVTARNASGSWRQQAIGDTPAKFYGAIVGDVGNTGRSRLIATAGDGIVYEYNYDGASWSFAQMPLGVFADGEMHNGNIGPARGDGVNRVYIAAAGSGRVYELSVVNGQWQVSVIATLLGSTDVIIGDGRNDGRPRMYITWRNGTTEFTWENNAWQTLTMSSNEPGWVHGIDLGPGRNDGLNRIYTANQGAGLVYEYFWNGTAFVKTLIDSTVNDSRNIGVGEGRNDGLFRIYTAAGDGNAYEYTWNGTSYVKTVLGNSGVGGVKVHAIPARARTDGLVRVYVAAADGGVYEWSWTGTAWQSGPMGLATAYMYGLDKGDALNTGRLQIYGSSYDGQAYVYEWMPSGPVNVPNVLGQTETEATTMITNAGLIVGSVTSAPSGTVAAGLVQSQTPLGDTQAPAGSAVALVLSSGPPPVTVPNVVTLPEADAVAAIEAVDLVVGTITEAPHATIPDGSVISQDPAGGLQRPAGTAVNLVVSTGPPPPVAVPSLVGETQTGAAALLAGVGLTLGTVGSAPSASVPVDRVASQDPAASELVPGGTPVNIVLSTGPPPVNVPPVVGLTPQQATDALAAVGLSASPITSGPSSTIAAGLIAAQNPAAGTPVPPGSSVALVISTGAAPVPVTRSDTTVADFTAGTPGANAAVTQIANGEVMLTPTAGSEFAAGPLPAGWTSTPWSGGGTVAFTNGALVLNSARAGTASTFGPGRSLEFVATFGSTSFQHVGFGLTFNETPWAIFSTFTGGGLYARTHNGSVAINTLIPGSWLNATHRFRIDWNASSVVFSIDNVQVASHANTIAAAMRPLASDYNAGGPAVSVDWMRLTPYLSPATFTSRVFDGGAQVTWSTAAWTADLPAGTTVTVSVRTGNTAVPDASWTAFSVVPSPGGAIGGTSRYIQYRLELSSTVPGQSPAVRDVTLNGSS